MNFDLRRWAEAELGVPPLPEARSYRALANYLAGSCESAGDMRLVLQPRYGPIQVCNPGLLERSTRMASTRSDLLVVRGDGNEVSRTQRAEAHSVFVKPSLQIFTRKQP